jgi:hypothetical protein
VSGTPLSLYIVERWQRVAKVLGLTIPATLLTADE